MHSSHFLAEMVWLAHCKCLLTVLVEGKTYYPGVSEINSLRLTANSSLPIRLSTTPFNLLQQVNKPKRMPSTLAAILSPSSIVPGTGALVPGPPGFCSHSWQTHKEVSCREPVWRILFTNLLGLLHQYTT